MASGNSFGNLLGFLAVGGMAVYALSKYSKAHFHAEAGNIRMRILDVAVEDQRITINIQVLNPNSEKMEVKSFLGDMYVAGKAVASIQMFGDYTAQPNSAVSIPLEARPSMALLFEGLHKQWMRGHVPVTFHGTANINNTPMPITLKYTS